MNKEYLFNSVIECACGRAFLQNRQCSGTSRLLHRNWNPSRENWQCRWRVEEVEEPKLSVAGRSLGRRRRGRRKVWLGLLELMVWRLGRAGRGRIIAWAGQVETGRLFGN